MFREFVPAEPKRKRESSLEEKSEDPASLPSSRSSSLQGSDTKQSRASSLSMSSGAAATGPTSSVATVKSISDRLKSLKKARKKEHKILSALFDDVNDTYKQLSKDFAQLMSLFDQKIIKYGGVEQVRKRMRKSAERRKQNGDETIFNQNFLALYKKLDELTGPDGITYREAFRGPVKRSWKVVGMNTPTLETLQKWNNDPVYIMWEKRQPRQVSSSAAGGAKKKSNYNDYAEEGKPHLTWELPSAASDVMSSDEGRRTLFREGRLVIVIEKFKDPDPTNKGGKKTMITQHRIKGIYFVTRTPRPGDVKLCLIDSRFFIERFMEGLDQGNEPWFYEQEVLERGGGSGASSSSK